MESAKEKLINALNETNLYTARFPVYANVTASAVTSKDEIKKLLFEQVTSPVKWQQTIENMINDGVEEFYEIGPGNVLQGLVKRINPDVKRFGIDKYEDLEKYL